MTVDRRSMLKGMAALGVGAPFLGGMLPALAGTAPAPVRDAVLPTLALVGPGGTDSAFVHAARARLGNALQVREASRQLPFLLDFEARLRSGQPMRVIGLVDDAQAALLLDLARSAGASVPWVGQHTVAAGLTRHRLHNTSQADGHARQLALQLQAAGCGFTLDEECQGRAGAPRQLSGRPGAGGRPDQWAAGVGHLLASLGSRRPGMAPLQPRGGAPLTGSLVSFAIQA